MLELECFGYYGNGNAGGVEVSSVGQILLDRSF